MTKKSSVRHCILKYKTYLPNGVCVELKISAYVGCKNESGVILCSLDMLLSLPVLLLSIIKKYGHYQN